MPSMYLDEKKPYKPFPPRIVCKRHAGEIVGIYQLIKIAGEGPNASRAYWKALCLKCGEIITINVSRMDNLKKSKGCSYCKGKICRTCHNQPQIG
jgi:hypothetical protein